MSIFMKYVAWILKFKGFFFSLLLVVKSVAVIFIFLQNNFKKERFEINSYKFHWKRTLYIILMLINVLYTKGIQKVSYTQIM